MNMSRYPMWRQRLLVSCLAMASLQAWASGDGPVITTSSVSVTGLTYHLEDLDPTDDITPSLTPLDTVTLLRLTTTGQPMQEATMTASPFESVSGLQLADTQGRTSGQLAQGAITLSSEIRLADLARMTTEGGDGTSVFFRTAAEADYPGDIQTSGVWTLSPGTRLVIDGTMQAQAHTDLSAALGTSQANGQLWGFSSAVLSIWLNNDSTNANGVVQSLQHVTGGSIQATDGFVPDMQTVQPLHLVFENWDSAPTGVSLQFNVAADSAIQALVPEPGTWALMALGLVGVAAAAGQRRRA
jgi:hypothetical protein